MAGIKENTDPIIRVVKRGDLNFWQRLLVRAVCYASAAILCILLLWAIGQKNPFPAVGYIFQGTFGNKYKMRQTFLEMALLLGIAVALCPAYEMRFWNVGAQGQILMGALGYALVMIYGTGLPNAAIIILGLLAAVAMGALWGFIPAAFKAKWGTNETLFTLMMNYIAIQLVSFCTINWQGAKSSLGYLNGVTKQGWLDEVLKSSGVTSLVNLGSNAAALPLIIVSVLVVFMFIYITYTKHGYELKVIGESLNTARYTGIHVRWTIMRTLLLSGALCGLIGFIYVSCVDHSISSETSGGYGFTAIIVCWLAYFNPFLMIIYAFLIVFLNRGAINLKNVSYAPALNEYSCEILVFVIILTIMLSEFFIRYKLVFRKKAVQVKPEPEPAYAFIKKADQKEEDK